MRTQNRWDEPGPPWDEDESALAAPMRALWHPVVLVLLLLPLLLLLLFFGVADHVFRLLGLSATAAGIVLAASLLGGIVNIPLTHRRIVLVNPAVERLSPLVQWMVPIVHYYSPVVMERVLALNVGGAVVPLVVSAYLLSRPHAAVGAALAATVVVALIVKLVARVELGVGVTLPAFVAPLAAALAARWMVQVVGGPAVAAAAVAYCAGTLGTLLGADLLNLPRTLRATATTREGRASGGSLAEPVPRTTIISIGGAGVFDGIFLAGLVAPLLAAL